MVIPPFWPSDSYLSNWYLIFNDVLDKHAPLITPKRVKMEKQAPWWNSEINSARIIRNNALKKARKSGSAEDWSSYKSARNCVYYLIRKAKSAYFRNTLNQKNLNPKDYWNHLKLLTGRKVNIVPTIQCHLNIVIWFLGIGYKTRIIIVINAVHSSRDEERLA